MTAKEVAAGTVLSRTGADLVALAGSLPMETEALRGRLENLGARATRLVDLVDEASADAQDWRKLTKEAAELNRDFSRRFRRLQRFAEQLEDQPGAGEAMKAVAHDIHCLLNGDEDGTVIRFDEAPSFAKRAGKV